MTFYNNRYSELEEKVKLWNYLGLSNAKAKAFR